MRGIPSEPIVTDAYRPSELTLSTVVKSLVRSCGLYPVGLPFTPNQGALIANGDGLSSVLGESGVSGPPFGPAAVSSHRASPTKAVSPKSSDTVKMPLVTCTLVLVRVLPTWLPPLEA